MPARSPRSPPETPPPWPGVPDDALPLPVAWGAGDGSADGDPPRVWARLDREPRGLVTEPGCVPGRIVVRTSRRLDRDMTLAAEVGPEGSLRLLPGAPVRIPAGRDMAALAFAGVEAGRALVALRPLTDGLAGEAVARVPVDVRPMDEFPDPLLVALAADPSAETPGAVAAGDRRICGIAGTAAGAVRVLRTGFREHDTEPTDVRIGIDDPAGVLGALPAFVTIPAGRTEPTEPIPVRLTERTGRAVLTLRAGVATTSLAVDSAAARWEAQASIVLPRGTSAALDLRLRPATVLAPEIRATADREGVVRVRAPDRTRERSAETFRVGLESLGVGTATLRVRADARPDLDLSVAVVPPEVEVRDGRPVLVSVPESPRGTITLAVDPPARLVLDDDLAGWTVVAAADARVTVRPPERLPGGELPLRIDGAPRVLRIDDRLHDPPRLPYELDLDGGPR